MRIGVLALQGDFEEHCEVLKRLGVEAVQVRVPSHLDGLDGLILPGGESTTIGKLATWYGLTDAIKQIIGKIPIWGTCGGLVFMAKNVGMDQPLLGVMDIVVQRNAFGRQVDSFEDELDIEGLEDGPFHGIFIRAPVIEEVGAAVKVLCRLEDGRIVAARQDKMMVTSFHPELADDLRVHQLFMKLIEESSK